MNARRNWNTSTASAPVDDPMQDAMDAVVGSEAFGNKFVADNAQAFYELLDYRAGPLGDAAIIRAVRRLAKYRDERAETQIAERASENIYAAREFNREALEDR